MVSQTNNKYDFIIRAIPSLLDKEIINIRENISKMLNLKNIKIKDACKILAWKSQQYRLPISPNKIREIILSPDNIYEKND